MSDHTNEENLCLVAILLLRRRRRKRRSEICRTTWTRNWILKRPELGVYANLVQEFRAEDPETFKNFHRLDKHLFGEVLTRVGPLIQREDTIMRSSICPGERLAATLRFLATGESFRSLSYQFRIGERTMSDIVIETCTALYDVLKEDYLKTPTSQEEWQSIADDFDVKWNYPCCIGALDGKHIAIKQPPNSGSEYFNYKHYFSVLLLGLVDANYKFVYVDVGAAGRAGDAGVYADSTLKKELDRANLQLPPPATVNGMSERLPFHIIGDDAFPLSTELMKPYPQRQLDKPKRIFNYRLSRARRTVENAFGILANRFRVFLTTIQLCPDKVVMLILASCCLHNLLVERNKHNYLSVRDVEDIEVGIIRAGAWRNDPHLPGMVANNHRNPTHPAKNQREQMTDYFMSDIGSVSWQERMVSL